MDRVTAQAFATVRHDIKNGINNMAGSKWTTFSKSNNNPPEHWI